MNDDIADLLAKIPCEYEYENSDASGSDGLKNVLLDYVEKQNG